MNVQPIHLVAILMLVYRAGTTTAGETDRYRIDHGGSSRSFTVYVPESYSPESQSPVVLNLHGTRGTSRGQAAISRMNEVADQEGFLVVYPQAVMSTSSGVRWNHLQLPDQVNDVSFIGAVLDQVEEDFNVDVSRVYSTGFSNGASMTHVLANAYPNRLAAVAPVAGSIAIRDRAGRNGPIDPVTSPRTSRPMPISFVHGTQDFLARFEGGASPVTGDLYPAVDDVISGWLSNNNCQTEPTISRLEDIVTTDRSTVELHRFLGCEEYQTSTGPVEAEVILFKSIGGNHQWPGGASPSPLDNALLQPRNDDINASREIWSFFSRHSLPETLNELVKPLQAGDADQDLDFDQFDLVQVQIAARYLTGQAATWGEGDWNGAPGGEPGSPPAGDGLFNQFDIIAAQQASRYLAGPYAAIQSDGQIGNGQTWVSYNTSTGGLTVDAPEGFEWNSINIDSAAGIFTTNTTRKLGVAFDTDVGANDFESAFGGKLATAQFANVSQTGWPEEFVVGDLDFGRSSAGGADLGNVDLVYVPEATSVLLLSAGIAIGLLSFRSVNR